MSYKLPKIGQVLDFVNQHSVTLKMDSNGKLYIEYWVLNPKERTLKEKSN